MTGCVTSSSGVTSCRRAALGTSARMRCSAPWACCNPQQVPPRGRPVVSLPLSQSESRMRQIRTSGLMCEEGKRTALRHRIPPRLYRASPSAPALRFFLGLRRHKTGNAHRNYTPFQPIQLST